MEKQIIEAANNLMRYILIAYGFELKHRVTIKFDLKGRAAGEAIYYVEDDAFVIRFNKEAGLDFIISDTLPHEMAHVLEAAFGGKMSHGKAWNYYCLELGGTGLTYHSLDLTPTRKTRMFLYVVKGEHCELTIIRHNRIQKKDMFYISNDTGNEIRKQHFVKEII